MGDKARWLLCYAAVTVNSPEAKSTEGKSTEGKANIKRHEWN